ncbi:MAG: nucleoside triphosphate pyrophosphohydrolase [Bacillota bacterium]
MQTCDWRGVLDALGLDPGAGLFTVGADQAVRSGIPADQPVLILGSGPDPVPGLLALLRGSYPPEHPVALVTGDAGGLQVNRRTLADLARGPEPGDTEAAAGPAGGQQGAGEARGWEGPWALYLPPGPEGAPGRSFRHLVQVMAALRGPGGCPWDREQDHRSLRPYLLEEAYEAVSAISAGDMEGLREELGDVLLQVVFHAQVAREAGSFDIDEVIRGLVEKLIRRHPHVFGTAQVAGSAEVLRNWEAIKQAERAGRTDPGGSAGSGPPSAPKAPPSLLDGVGRGMPALTRAAKVQRRAAKVGFDWSDAEGPLQKLAEEVQELREVYRRGERERYEEELGDVLFAAVNVARFLQVDPEVALTAAVDKFCRRFAYIEAAARQAGKDLAEMGLAEMDRLWEEAKRAEK